MQLKQDLAIVLRSIPYEERHRIITALTEQHGQISAMAKNSIQSRRFGGTLEPFAASTWTFTQKPGAELCQLSEAQIRNSFEGLRQDFKKLSLASVLNELIIKLAPQHQACGDLFRLHSNALFAINEASIEKVEQSGIAFLNAYLAKLLQWSGSQPQLSACLQCQLPLSDLPPRAEVSCLIADAGWVCGKCRAQETRHIRERSGNAFHHSLLRVTPVAVQDFQMSLRTPIRSVFSAFKGSENEHRALFQFLEALYVFHIPGFDQKPLKSLRFLDLKSTVLPEAVTQQ